jgi:AraC-like DNA-binding protein
MLFVWQPTPMSFFSQIDLMARGGSIALLALWSWLLIRDHRGQFAGRLAMVMALAIICYLIVTAELFPRPTISGLILALCGSSTPGIFWLFAKAWFNDEKHIRRRDLALVLLAAANILVMLISYPDDRIINLIAGTLFRISMLSFAAAGLWEAWRGREGDLIESRRRLRPRLVAAVGTYVVLIAVSEIAVHNLGMPYWLIGIVTSSIVFITFLFCAAMFGMRQADLFGPVNGAKPAAGKPVADDSLAEKLRGHMVRELAWRDERLSIAALAAQLGEQEYRLRRVINGQLGHRNFAAFLNGYRLAEVTAALADPTQKDVPIITIALDAGFGSLGPFNRAFREAEGMTPSAFRAQTAG